MERLFTCNGVEFTRFWHCFGNKNHMAPLNMVLDFLKESRTNVIPINTHNLDDHRNPDALEVGYAGVPFHILSQHLDTSKYIKMLNINLQTSAEDAIGKTKIAYDMLGFPIVKLEVLDAQHVHSNQEAIVTATKALIDWDANLMVCPLFENDLETAEKLVDAGAPLLRVMGSGIGTCGGVKDLSTFKKICELGVPVILDGGIGSLAHARQAMESGAAGILINSMLFQQAESPETVMHNFAEGFREILLQTEALEFAGA